MSIILAETSLHFETNRWREQHHWSTIGRHLLCHTVFFFIIFLKIKPNSVYQALDGCLIEMTTMGTLVGMAKWWLHLLNRGLVSHSFLKIFQDFDYRPLCRGLGWLLNGGSTVLQNVGSFLVLWMGVITKNDVIPKTEKTPNNIYSHHNTIPFTKHNGFYKTKKHQKC